MGGGEQVWGLLIVRGRWGGWGGLAGNVGRIAGELCGPPSVGKEWREERIMQRDQGHFKISCDKVDGSLWRFGVF